ncbi:MAG: nucleotidyl transferase AbiEii/AbiGii toxin family protein, partial [Polyangiaceae bacterium]
IAPRLRLRARPDGHQATRTLPATAKDINLSARDPIIQPARAQLKAKGLVLVDVSAPKQTDTTQRWKVGLQVRGLGFPLRTKVEFSRRDAIEGALFEGIEREVVRAYDLTPSLATHYTTHAAIAQKIHALAARSEPQARDVFDLNVLFARSDARGLKLDNDQKRHLARALDHALAISFDEYQSKVVAYLDPSQALLYADRSAWDAMQGAVAAQLEALQ